MTVYLSEADVESVLTMDTAIEAVEEAFRLQANGAAFNHPRYRLPMGGGTFMFMAATAPGLGVMGTKTYGATRSGAIRFYVNLFSTASGELTAVIEASRLGQVRTGAASGVATKHMARQDAVTVGMIGAGYQARTQLEAVCRVRHILKARVFSRDPEKRMTFARNAARDLDIDVEPADSTETCVRGADIVITITPSSIPVLDGGWLSAGAHVNAAGSNHWSRREIDVETIRLSSVIVADDIEAAKIECGELIYAVERGVKGWHQVHNLSSVVAGTVRGRNAAEEVTLFESQGLALEDIAVGHRLVALAQERGLGSRIPV